MNRHYPYGSVFETDWWWDAMCDGPWQAAEVYDKGKLIARLPFVYRRIITDRCIIMPKLTQNAGPWFDLPDDQILYGRNRHEKEVVPQLLAQLPKHDFLWIQISPEQPYILPYLWQGYEARPRFTYRFEDLSDLEKIYANMYNVTKRNIKTAQKRVEIREDFDYERLWLLIEKTYAAQGSRPPLSQKLFFRLIDACKKNDAGVFLAAIDEQENYHSGGYFVYDQNTCYYLLGGKDPQYNASCAQSLVIWEGIRFAQKRSRVFDFEGSMVEGIEQFFRQFGGRCTPYYAIHKMSLIHGMALALLKK